MKEQLQSIKNLGKAVGITALMALGAKEGVSQTTQPVKTEQSEVKRIESPRLAEMSDANMPDGFERKHLYAKLNGKETNMGSVFFFEPGKTQARFLSNDKHGECFPSKPNYEAVENIVKQDGEELVIAFAGAYRSPSGNIEGVAYENGESVGETSYSKWHGFVYVGQNGNIEMYRMKDAQGNFNQGGADALVSKAQKEKGSLYQQIPAIWNGDQKLKPSGTGVFEMRAICENKNGDKFIINCTEKITQDAFLKMCLELKDEEGNPAVYNLMLTDTGECSLAAFRDKNQIESDKKTGGFTSHQMNDEQFQQKGFTNLLVLSQY